MPEPTESNCYKLVQGLRVTCLLTGRYNTKCSEWLDQDLDGWIQVSLLPQSSAWLIGFGSNHSLLFILQYWRHHIETRQLQ